MTDGFQSYLITVCAAAILAVLIPALITQNMIRKTAEFAGGMLLLIIVLAPIVTLDLSEFRQVLTSYMQTSPLSSKDLSNQDFVAERIRSQCEEYILDKADTFGMTVEAKVRLNDNPTYPLPIGVSVSGRYSPWQKEQLSSVITQDLGIPEDQQEWESR